MLVCTRLMNGSRLVAMDNQRSKWLVFACVAIAQFMVILDVTVTNVALPVIKVQLHFGNAAIGWVVTAYVLLVEDRHGRRGGRPAARRRADLVRGLAVELLHQRAGRRGDDRGDRPGGAGL